MSWLERAISSISPEWALKRASAASKLDIVNRYRAVEPSRLRDIPIDNGSADRVISTGMAFERMKGAARELEQNYDLAEAILLALVNNIVGTSINVTAVPKRKDGTVHYEFAKLLDAHYDRWSKSPTVAGNMSRGKMERLACRTWMRDGEYYAKAIEGYKQGYNPHNTVYPFSLECLEGDYLSTESDPDRGLTLGVWSNAYGKPTAYRFWLKNPNGLNWSGKYIDVPARLIFPLVRSTRLDQTRGISIFAPILSRIDDTKNYEEYERMAAKVDASLTFYVRKGNPDQYDPDNYDSEGNREIRLGPAMGIDNLAPGEDIGTIQSNRPSTMLTPFRDSMIDAMAAGTGVGPSSVSNKYEGSYSSKRQEAAEKRLNYDSYTDEFIAGHTRPIRERWLSVSILEGAIEVPPDVDMDTIFDADYFGVSQPYINPNQEANADKTLIESKVKSPQQIIRKRGGNPEMVLEQIAQWNDALKRHNLIGEDDG